MGMQILNAVVVLLLICGTEFGITLCSQFKRVRYSITFCDNM